MEETSQGSALYHSPVTQTDSYSMSISRQNRFKINIHVQTINKLVQECANFFLSGLKVSVTDIDCLGAQRWRRKYLVEIFTIMDLDKMDNVVGDGECRLEMTEGSLTWYVQPKWVMDADSTASFERDLDK